MTTPEVKNIIKELGERMSGHTGLNGSLKFDFGDKGSVLVDGNASPPVGDGAGRSAQCTISLTIDTYEKLKSGDLDATSAFMQGKLRVAGDMGLAMKLGPILQKARG
jgi:putative sterol carrier protein